ncbi:holo-(acyl-carrier-protein) synthase [Gloeocapsa sp. PCC 7428]|nr:holo-(acyl-carrier-protein) synthase [Gloeocapsa sp. PCC 7428]
MMPTGKGIQGFMYLQIAQPRQLAEIKGIGIDIAPVSKIASLVSRYNSETLTLLFTPREIEQCQSAPYPNRYYAVCFAAKEAVGKALGTGLVDINWNEIESIISQSELTIKLRGAAKQKALQCGVKAWLATWCYWDDYVMVHVLSKGEHV